ncbi:MAG: HAD family phosphatase [Methanobacteriaceae archaeon]|nr:HAD family phosphatase [Methanobacteriaceae archaeon]
MGINNKISLIIFDMDGLMFDTERLNVETWIKAGETAGIKIKKQIVLESTGLDIQGAERVFKKYLGDDFPYHQMRDLRLAYLRDYIEKNGVPLKKGLYELLEYLVDKPVFKAVATSTERERTEFYLEAAGIRQEFDVIICGEDVSKGKPHPDIFLAAARKLNSKNEECLVLEDSKKGIIAALKANMMPVLVSDSRVLEDFDGKAVKHFQNLLEVKQFLEGSNL